MLLLQLHIYKCSVELQSSYRILTKNQSITTENILSAKKFKFYTWDLLIPLTEFN